MRVCLNSRLIDIDETTNLFVAKKQKTFNDYVKQKTEYYKEKEKISSKNIIH